MWSSAIAIVSLLAYVASAFPSDSMNLLLSPNGVEARAAGPTNPPQGQGALPLIPPPFDAAAQYISTSGAHKFQPPGPNDARGECPGLNALANHGYIPRNGIATIAQFTTACQQVYGMAVDLAGFLAVYGALVDGPLTSFSIGGLPHTGILGSHNNYETDSSSYKPDLNQYGSNVDFVLSQFNELYNMQSGGSATNYNLEVLRQYRKSRFQESISENPWFVYLPFPGIEVGNAGYMFQYRLFGNKSQLYPEGVLNREVLKSFMAVSGPDNKLVHTPGHERIPENWYKRNPAAEYTIPDVQADILYFAQVEPEILTIGCNEGTVNSYDTFDPAVLTNGAYTAQQLAANPICFASQFAIAQLPGLTGLSTTLLAPLISTLTGAISGMNCPVIGGLNMSALAACPGFTQYGGPTGPIAPGAIQM